MSQASSQVFSTNLQKVVHAREKIPLPLRHCSIIENPVDNTEDSRYLRKSWIARKVTQSENGKTMDKTVRKYSLEDPQQDLDEKAFWNHQLYEYKVLVLENHGLAWSKMNPQRRENGNIIGFRSILQVVKQVKVR